MFVSTYGISPIQPIYTGRIDFIHKAIDHDRRVEVFRIGMISGEDVPFEGDIYCISYASAFVPFVVRSVNTISYVDIADYNQSQWDTSRHGKFPVTSICVSNFGDDLGKIETGPRGSIHYAENLWEGKFHGYQFQSNVEKEKLFQFIQEALPILFFDNYSTHCESRPSICAFVKALDGENNSTRGTAGEIERESLNLSKMAIASSTYSELLQKAQRKALAIEEIMKEVLDIERQIFFHGRNAYPFGLWRDDGFWELLRESFKTRYQNNFRYFEEFLFEIMTLIQGRVYGRINFEKYASYISVKS